MYFGKTFRLTLKLSSVEKRLMLRAIYRPGVLHTVYHQLHHCKGGFSLSANTQQFYNVLVIKHLHCFSLAEKFKLLKKNILRKFSNAFIITQLICRSKGRLLKGTTPVRFAHLKKFSLNFSSSSFVIRVNLLHP